ncbi:MAG: DUF2239 family protein [Pseudomonadales bacterium]|nr:DUF2239 family protein [Pseudomonadales bacterium]
MPDVQPFAAFSAGHLIAEGELRTVVLAVKRHIARNTDDSALIFDNATGRVTDIDFRGSEDEVLARLTGPLADKRGRGRPKLGVVGKEVTLLPRHWEWLATQPGGASVALRRLVDEARRNKSAEGQQRAAQNRAYQFAATMAGDLPGFEEAMRALFSNDKAGFDQRTVSWPEDIRVHAMKLGFELPEEAV